ncbi:YhcN/YlaJ family sporulation lipoprotein [Virgibacillus sp. W0181]|uniref:YhcN/YlaJ family sporulation lipoprotein n=1 Tax=Virgibacillus sp. W0181 TaxID=3391581 RepID=UPI003F46925A
MYVQKILATCFILLVLSACQNEPTLDSSQEEKEEVEVKKLSTTVITDQGPSNQAKEMLSNYEEVTSIKAVNTEDDLMIALEVEHHERFSLDQLEKSLHKKVKKAFPDLSVLLTTDKKMIIELEKLEKRIADHSLSTKQLKKKLKDLIKLSKEHT